MSGYNATQTDGSPTPIPMSSAISPGDPTPYAIKGGPKVVDSQGNTIVDVAMYTYDGDNETMGAKADTASTDSTQTTKTHMAFLKGLVKIFADVWDGTNHLLHYNLKQIGGTAVDANSGNKSAGTQRVVLATDQPALTNAQPSNLTQVAGNSIAPGNNAMPTLPSAAAGFVAAYGSNAAALTSNTDYTFKWGAGGTTQVNRVKIFNGTTINILYEESDTATNAGSPYLIPGQTLYFDVQTAAVHLQGAGTPNVNGSTSGNVVVRGWL